MTIRHIRVFVGVYQRMNITHAASDLHMTQPAVTRTIKELESHYGTTFFERINQRLHATQSGNRYYLHAKKVLDAFDAMESDTRTSAEYFDIRIGSTYYLGSFLLPAITKDFKHHFPHAALRAQIMNISNIQHALHMNKLDFAIVEDQIDDAKLCGEVFLKDRLVLLLPKGHPLNMKENLCVNDLQGMPFLMRESGSNNRRRLEDMLQRNDVCVDPVLESYSTHAILSAIVEGICLSILPEYLAMPWVKAGLIDSRPLVDQPMVRKNYIIWHKEKHLSAKVHETMKLCHRAALRLREKDTFLPPDFHTPNP